MTRRSFVRGVARLLVVGGVAGACGSETSTFDPLTSGSDAGSTFSEAGAAADGAGLFVPDDAGLSPGKDTDEDGVPDAIEGAGDDDGDGTPNYLDPINDGAPPAITLVAITTNFNSPIGIDYHEPTNSVVLSVNYPNGTPSGFERIEFDGTHQPFSTLSGLTDEVKIATARSGNPAGFTVGDLFVGNGVDGQIVRITDGGATVVNPWVDFPGDGNGLMRGSLYIDRTGVFGGDLIAVTTAGEVWRVTVNAQPTRIASFPGVHLEGTIVVPDKPARFGPLAGKLIVGAEEQHLLYAIAPDGTSTTYSLGVDVEDLDLNTGKENFFGVDFGGGRLLGADPSQWGPMVGDVILTQEQVIAGTSGLFRLAWNGAQVVAQPIPLTAQSATVGHWEHVTFAAAGIAEIAPVH
jgi:hypothetical protein